MRFDEALRVQRGDVISFVGAGGKTSALFRLANELKGRGWRVAATTTTRVAVDELYAAPVALPVDSKTDFLQVSEALTEHGFVFLYDDIRNDKALGIHPQLVRQLLDRVDSDVLLIEADGARRLPFKVPYAHEPMIPAETTRLVLVAGLDVLGQPLDDEHVYNPEAIIARYGYTWGAKIIWPWVAAVLRDEMLGLQGVGPQTSVTVLLNKTPQLGIHQRRARLMSRLLLRSPRIQAVAIGAVQADDPIYEVRRPVAAIVLAAGLSSRMDGKMKVLLPWGHETVLEAILRRLRIARLDETIVITGRSANKVYEAAERFAVPIVHNPRYAAGGMLSSLQAGIRALQDSRFEACLVVLGDQPQIQGRVIANVITAYAEGKGTIVAPKYQGQRGHPILIDRQHWQALLELSPGSAPRDLLDSHVEQITYVAVNTDSILKDIDTPTDYEAARRHAGLA